MIKKLLVASIVAVVIFSACKKETETFKTAAINEYAPLTVGKFITYKLDSFRYLPFSIQSITITYEVKFLVDAAITDNLGRPAFRIIRYIRSSPTAAWVPDNTFTAINDENSFEFVENNLRFIRLRMPIISNFIWKGNSFINTSSQYSDLRYLEDWDYAYDSINAPLKLGAINLDSTLKVAQRDEIIGNPSDPNSYSEKNFSIEYYAKGIGLVYKRFLHSEYQPPTGSRDGYYSDATKGFILTMTGHN